MSLLDFIDILQGDLYSQVHPKQVHLWRAITYTTAWAIRKSRNAVVMHNLVWNASKILADIQALTFL